MRPWVAVLLGSVGCAGCLGGQTPSPEQDLGAGLRDGGLGSTGENTGVEVLAHGLVLPPAVELAPERLAPDAGAGDASDMRVHVSLRARVVTRPCIVPSGTYCDGFAAVLDDGRIIAVDTYAYLGPRPPCRAQWGEGASVTELAGVWQQRRTGASEISVLALAQCSPLNGGSQPPGSASEGGAVAPATHDVRALQAGWAPALHVTVTGLVVARWSTGSGAFGFTLQDPDGAPRSGVRVFRGKDSTAQGHAPEVGDLVRVTARTGSASPRQLEL